MSEDGDKNCNEEGEGDPHTAEVEEISNSGRREQKTLVTVFLGKRVNAVDWTVDWSTDGLECGLLVKLHSYTQARLANTLTVRSVF